MSGATLDLAEQTEDPARLWSRDGASAWDAALPLVVNYFAPTAKWIPTYGRLWLRRTEGDAPYAVEDDGKAAVRGALADAMDLVSIVDDVLRSPNFKYRRETVEHVGHPRGRVDLMRYIQSRTRIEVPRRYQVSEVKKVLDTPENVLTVACLLLSVRVLDDVLKADFVPASGPEGTLARALRDNCTRLLRNPSFHGLQQRAERIQSIADLVRVTDRVRVRLAAGHVMGRPYEQLVTWTERAIFLRAVSESGEHPAVAYGDEFNDRVFELWTLAMCLEAAAARAGLPDTVDAELVVDRATPWASWHRAGLHLWYRPRLTALPVGASVGWTMAGEPDVVVQQIDENGVSRYIIIDAKRRRSPAGRPSELLYKVLGYFENLPDLDPCMGTIVFWSPEGYVAAGAGRSRHSIESTTANRRKGRVLAIGVSPSDGLGTRLAFAEVLDLLNT